MWEGVRVKTDATCGELSFRQEPGTNTQETVFLDHELRSLGIMYRSCLNAANLKDGEMVHCLAKDGIIPGHLWPEGGAQVGSPG